MKLYPIETGNFKLDGGAMFGVVPKQIWQKTNPADDLNLVNLTMRCLLIEDGKNLILVDTGIGNKQNQKFFSHYHLWGDFSLEKSLAKYGFVKDDITDVFHTHLHFDHCGGSVEWNESRTSYQTTFKNAKYWTNKKHWNSAKNPNAREKSSFLEENFLPIEKAKQLHFIPLPTTGNYGFAPDLKVDIIFVDGHTEKQMLPVIKYQEKTIVFVADLIPTIGHIPLVYVPSYDIKPLLSLEEKEKFLKQAIDNEYILFFEHDINHELATLKMTEKGVRVDEVYKFNDVFGY